MSCCSHRFPHLFLAIRLYHPPLPVGLTSTILCPYRAVFDTFQQLVLHLRVRVKGFTRESHFISLFPLPL